MLQEAGPRVAAAARQIGLTIDGQAIQVGEGTTLLGACRALGIETPRDIIDAKIFQDHADWLLFDAKPPKDATRPGGNARAFDWGLLKTYVGRTPWGLAGGLTRTNVAKALKDSGARLVDVSSGVESRPGVKSPAKIRAFVKAVRAAKVS